MKTQLNMDKIAKGLGAERQGKVAALAATSARCSFWLTSRPASACRPAGEAYGPRLD